MVKYTDDDDGDSEEGVVQETLQDSLEYSNVFSLRNDASCGTPEMLLNGLLRDMKKGDCTANKILVIAYDSPENSNDDSTFQIYNCNIDSFEAIALLELTKKQFMDML